MIIIIIIIIEAKNVSDFFQKHFDSATDVSPFARRGSNVDWILWSRRLYFIYKKCANLSEMFLGLPGKETILATRLRAQETFWKTIFPQQCFLVCRGGGGLVSSSDSYFRTNERCEEIENTKKLSKQDEHDWEILTLILKRRSWDLECMKDH